MMYITSRRWWVFRSLSWIIELRCRSSCGRRRRPTLLPNSHHHRPARQTMSTTIEESNHRALAGCSPSSLCTCKYHRRKLAFWQEPGPSRPKENYNFLSRHCHFQNSRRTLGQTETRGTPWFSTGRPICCRHTSEISDFNNMQVSEMIRVPISRCTCRYCHRSRGQWQERAPCSSRNSPRRFKFVNLSLLCTTDLPSLPLYIQTGLDGTRTWTTGQPIYHRRNSSYRISLKYYRIAWIVTKDAVHV